METKGKRAPRPASAIEAAPAPAKAAEVPAVSIETAKFEIEAPKPAELPAEVAEPAQTAVNPAAVAAASPATQPSIGRSVPAASAPSEGAGQFGRNALSALVESQVALARGLEALSAEMAGLALLGIDTAARTATNMLGIKTLSDAIEVNAGFTCSSFDAVVGGSARLSELGAKVAAEASQPILRQFGKGWVKPARFGS